MTLVIRPSSPADADIVSNLLAKSYGQLLQSAYEPGTLEKALPLITQARPELLASGTYYVAQDQSGEVIGVGGWTRASPTGEGETATNGNIRHFGTDPDHAGKGVGRALMMRTIMDACHAGLEELNCYSTLNGEGFYEACGFVTVEPYTVTLPGNIPFPSVRMTRRL